MEKPTTNEGFISFFNSIRKDTSNLKRKVFSREPDKNDIECKGSKSKTKDGSVHPHPTKGTHWVYYIFEKSFDSSGCSLTKN